MFYFYSIFFIFFANISCSNFDEFCFDELEPLFDVDLRGDFFVPKTDDLTFSPFIFDIPTHTKRTLGDISLQDEDLMLNFFERDTKKPKAKVTKESKAKVTKEPKAKVAKEPKAKVAKEPKAKVAKEPKPRKPRVKVMKVAKVSKRVSVNSKISKVESNTENIETPLPLTSLQSFDAQTIQIQTVPTIHETQPSLTKKKPEIFLKIVLSPDTPVSSKFEYRFVVSALYDEHTKSLLTSHHFLKNNIENNEIEYISKVSGEYNLKSFSLIFIWISLSKGVISLSAPIYIYQFKKLDSSSILQSRYLLEKELSLKIYKSSIDRCNILS